MRWAQGGQGGEGARIVPAFLRTDKPGRQLARPGPRECHLLNASLKEQLSQSRQKRQELRPRFLALGQLDSGSPGLLHCLSFPFGN